MHCFQYPEICASTMESGKDGKITLILEPGDAKGSPGKQGRGWGGGELICQYLSRIHW